MSTKASRWASTEEDTVVAERRKQEKQEKKRLKEEKARRAAQAPAAQADTRQEDDDGRPSKRRRVSQSPPAAPEAHLVSLPAGGFGPSASISEYELLNAIEEGSYGKVSRARTKSTGTIVALKKLKFDNAPGDGFPITGLREIQTLKACSHPHIISLLEVVVGPSLSDIYLVMPFFEHDLKTILSTLTEPFLPSETKLLLTQLTSALHYLHAQHILHRDLKTSNLLLNNLGTLKLADFGMARYTSVPPPRHLTQLVVTLWYRPPELLLGTTSYDSSVDIWSLGCIFAELLTSDPLFPGKNEVDQLSLIFSLLGTPTSSSWPGFRSLPNAKALHPVLAKTPELSSRLNASKFPYLSSAGLRLLASCLSLNPMNRPTAEELLSHRYFTEEPRAKPKEMFPTFPSKAGLEKRRRLPTPQAPVRGEAPKIDERQLAGIFEGVQHEGKGGGFALRVG
ncbi:uncharacterized protein HMPREF1541_02556 [Cyphellophora europaea CBS 101466]|uniref:cyclin-dependent kinase n=1 Tax=Cyphellophora europaea (strain CBS 101466) TaxID=1220924 RepID=W2S403_CYPE1|nr:uncharacterized protein HMPREF1541_02556 [Cyphellophora europaea CBS 101466]ETN43397.1 hypothetical protein HMPREF1541_02556 [Cyphellophora europaea CBS 101466]